MELTRTETVAWENLIVAQNDLELAQLAFDEHPGTAQGEVLESARQKYDRAYNEYRLD
jgi:hypothetical protein